MKFNVSIESFHLLLCSVLLLIFSCEKYVLTANDYNKVFRGLEHTRCIWCLLKMVFHENITYFYRTSDSNTAFKHEGRGCIIFSHIQNTKILCIFPLKILS